MAVSPSLIAEAVGWRREFHAAPELGYQEQETSRRVAELLASFGLQVHRGLAGTGVVATLENGPGPVIGLRADMDALPITELGSVSYRSRRPGVMHACGHDGHTAMLLAAAAHLAQSPNGWAPPPPVQRHRPLCLPAGGREPRRRAQNGGRGVVRALPDGRHLRAA